MNPAFLELSAVLVLATILGIFAKILKQPLILAYIFAGILISAFGFFHNNGGEVFSLLSNMGIAFLLFLVGVELKIEDLKYVGRTAILTGLGQILFTTLIGFILVSALGFATIPALFIAFALTFSSTVIIIKLLSEKHELQTLHGKISVGFLLVQDFVAVVVLMVLSGFGAGHYPTLASILLILIKGAVLAAISYFAPNYLLKHLFKWTSSSVELLFISALSWAFFMAALAASLGFSLAIGAFLAGLSIASSQYRLQISARVKPIRDFFIVIFFILLGASISLGAAHVMAAHVVVLSLFILVGDPLIVFAIMLSLKFRNRTSFLTSVTTAQVSEFSLILMTVGKSLGYLNDDHVALVSAVAIVTIALSSYLILYGNKIFKFLEKPMQKILPEHPRNPYVPNRETLDEHVILIGGEQMGWDILQFLKTKIADKQKILVVDFNPDIIKTLTASGYNAIFGDVSDPEVLEELEFGRAKLVIITDPVVEDNIHLIKFAKSKNYKGPVMSAAYWIHDAIKIYEGGADYVVVPETVGGDHIAGILNEHWDHLEKIKKAKSKNFERFMRNKVF